MWNNQHKRQSLPIRQLWRLVHRLCLCLQPSVVSCFRCSFCLWTVGVSGAAYMLGNNNLWKKLDKKKQFVQINHQHWCMNSLRLVMNACTGRFMFGYMQNHTTRGEVQCTKPRHMEKYKVQRRPLDILYSTPHGLGWTTHALTFTRGTSQTMQPASSPVMQPS